MTNQEPFDPDTYQKAQDDAYPHTMTAQFDRVIVAWHAFMEMLGIHRLANWLARRLGRRARR